ncbi:hypothetical protein [Nocardia sp. NPDC052112]|uniref:DUF7373 family lipoprotein n=1 Tax=Nocardia sp. NPDC052112 TaxID=3155646 RepID=UPI003432DEB0
MKSARIAFGGVLLVAVLTVTSGCDESERTAPPAVDVSKLDSGNYPTTPRTIERSEEQGAIQEALALGEHVPLLMDVDSRMVFNIARSGNRAFTQKHPPPANSGVGNVEEFFGPVPGLIAGFGTYAQRRQEFALGSDVEMAILRFSTADQAGVAMNFLAAEDNKEYPAKATATIPGYPEARAGVSELNSLTTWLTRGEYVLRIWTNNPLATPPDPVPLAEFTKRILDKQFEMLRDYRPTSPDKLAALPVDVDGLLGRTIPSKAAVNWTPGVYTPHAALHVHSRSDLTSRLFTDTEVDAFALDDSGVYRTADAAAAARLIAGFIDQATDSFAVIDPPPGLPDAKCLKKLDDPVVADLSADYQCYVAYDRYVGNVGSSQVQDLYQQAAAQYKLLVAGH